MKARNMIPLLILLFLSTASPWGKEVVSLGDDLFETREAKITSPMTSGEKVIINSAMGLSGKLNVISEEAEQASFVYKKILKTSDPSEAMDYADVIEITLEATPEGLKLLLQAPNPAPWGGSANSGRVEGDLYLPSDCHIEIDAAYFDLKIDGPFRSVRNKSSFGRLDIRKITQEVNLATSSREIVAKDISGDIALTTGNGEIKIENLVSRTRPADIINENANIYVSDASGSVNIKNSYGKIRLDNFHLKGADSRITGSYGPIRLEISDIANTALTISNQNEDIQVTLPDAVSAKFLLKVGLRGKINVEGLKARPTTVKSDRLEFITGAGESEIAVDIEGNGNISLKGIPAKER